MVFPISSERSVSCAISQAAWSPNKDIIACITQDGQLQLYREFPGFQCIWAVSSLQRQPTALCWHPDGLEIALGESTGRVTIINAENGKAARECTLHGSAVSCLTWASISLKRAAGLRLHHPMSLRHARLCPWRPQQPAGVSENSDPNFAGRGASVAGGPRVLKRDLERLDILCSCDAAGELCLAAFGHFPVVRFPLTQVLAGTSLADSPCVAQRVALCPSMSRLFIAVGSPEAGALGLVGCSLGSLNTQLPEFHTLLVLVATLYGLADDLHATAGAVTRHLATARSTFVRVMSNYGAADTAGAEEEGHWERLHMQLSFDIQAMLFKGSESPTLELFLGQRPGEYGLQQAALAVDAALSQAGQLLAVDLHDQLQRVVLLLEELGGMLGNEGSAACDFQVSDVQAACAAAAELLVRLEEATELVTNATCLYRVFFHRLVWNAAAHSPDSSRGADGSAAPNVDAADHHHALQVFMQHLFASDALTEQLAESAHVHPSHFRPQRKPRAPRKVSHVLSLMHDALGHTAPAAAERLSFLKALSALVEQLHCLFSEPAKNLSPTVTPQFQIQFAASPTAAAQLHMPAPRLHLALVQHPQPAASGAAAATHELTVHFHAALQGARPDGVVQLLVRYRPSDVDVTDVQGAALQLCSLHSGGEVVDSHPFTRGRVVVLTRHMRPHWSGAEARTEAAAAASHPSAALPGSGEGGALDGAEACLHLLELRDKFTPLTSTRQRLQAVSTIISGAGFARQAAWEASCKTPNAYVNAPLAVSVSRALAAVCALQRITVYDIADVDKE